MGSTHTSPYAPKLTAPPLSLHNKEKPIPLDLLSSFEYFHKACPLVWQESIASSGCLGTEEVIHKTRSWFIHKTRSYCGAEEKAA